MIIVLSIFGMIALLGLVAYVARKQYLDQKAAKLENKLEVMGASFRALSLSYSAVTESGERFSRTIEFPMIVVGMDIAADRDQSVAVIMQRDPDGRLRVVHESEDWRRSCEDETNDYSF